ncbi:hypothetical protein F444_02480 [Phytophthora nicotianae P1976]|uniref:Uncharacterized protein n=1 Tax=Phytophthora nicotianae P1976 TaxID=1317066 RepID=A0A081AXA5_PHYNI|nr:hypothetical protein F444_02480 [Phytophthora nicotianae P1976]
MGISSSMLQRMTKRGKMKTNQRPILLHPAESDTQFDAIRFADVEPSDPNLVLDDGEKRIESDGEGAEDAVGVEELSDAKAEPDSDLVESVATETSRVARLLSEVELERLHMRVEGSSEIFDETQLAVMAVRGWTVYPENVVADIVDDPEIDKMYEGYCKPSKDVLETAKSPISLFFYFLPRAFWRHVAHETQLYWEQTFEARLEKAMAKEGEVTDRPQKSREKLRKKNSSVLRRLHHMKLFNGSV